MRIDVTLEDLELGERGSPSRCPVARALLRALPVHWVFVGSWPAAFVRLGWGDDMNGQPWAEVTLALPAYVQRNIQVINRGETVEPFSFAVSDPDLMALGYRLADARKRAVMATVAEALGDLTRDVWECAWYAWSRIGEYDWRETPMGRTFERERLNGPRCIVCLRTVRQVLDGEEWCDHCERYQRPRERWTVAS